MTNQTRLVTGPFNRVEGDLEITLDVADGAVTAAYANSPLYRGFERMLIGKDPRDAMTITPRICGICSISQSAAAARAIAAVQGLSPTPAGAQVTGLIHGVENVIDHLTHFCLFFMPDFAKPVYQDQPWFSHMAERFTAVEGSAVHAFVQERAQLMHIMGILAGKWPHTLAIQPGGVTKAPDSRDRIKILTLLRRFRSYLERTLFGCSLEEVGALNSLSDLEAWRAETSHRQSDVALFLDAADAVGLSDLGTGPGRFMSFGAYETKDGPLFARGLYGVESGKTDIPFDDISEQTGHSWMLGDARHPFEGMTVPDEDMREAAYSWCKAPRLGGETVEVGALARQVVDGHPLALALVADGGDARARIIGRLLEVARTVPKLEQWTESLRPGDSFLTDADLPTDGQGVGLVEAARGSLGHWLKIKGGVIAGYQIIAPTTWNFSPRDDRDVPGPVEQALIGAPVRPGEQTPIAVQHVVRSFDPCMVCTVH